MFDTTCAEPRKWIENHRSMSESPFEEIGRDVIVGGVTWEEHCVECGQPECFKTCHMYERSFDGKCRRFESGIVPLWVKDRLYHGCTFRKWAKIEGQFSGGYTTVGRMCWWTMLDRGLSKMFRGVNRIMAFIPGRIGAITIYRRLKLWMSRVSNYGSNKTVSGLVLRCCSSRSVKIHLALIKGEECILDEVFDLNGSWQEFNVTFRPVMKGARFLIFSVEEAPFDLVFDSLEILPHPMTEDCLHGGAKLLSKPAGFVKCVAWDLDNTLWNGILVEDGPEKLKLNEDAVQLIKTLDSRGIINTVLSKNDKDSAWTQLEKFGIGEYFVFPMINWLPKSENLRIIAKTINIGLDTFAFVDDSPFERGEVGDRLPMVRVFKNTEIRALAGRPEFNPPVSGEGTKRRLSYQKEMQRIAAAQSFAGDYMSFLRSCEIVITLFPLKNADTAIYDRCYELIQRTNQLTLAGRRYTGAEFSFLVATDCVDAWGIRCKDRFGDYGIVGVVITSRVGVTLSVVEFVMSCRVAKKQCEYGVISAIALQAKENNAEVLSTRLVKTGRNGALISAFDEMPFEKKQVDGDNAFDYSLQLKNVVLPESVNKVIFK